jgi:hypothetical protein
MSRSDAPLTHLALPPSILTQPPRAPRAQTSPIAPAITSPAHRSDPLSRFLAGSPASSAHPLATPPRHAPSRSGQPSRFAHTRHGCIPAGASHAHVIQPSNVFRAAGSHAEQVRVAARTVSAAAATSSPDPQIPSPVPSPAGHMCPPAVSTCRHLRRRCHPHCAHQSHHSHPCQRTRSGAWRHCCPSNQLERMAVGCSARPGPD